MVVINPHATCVKFTFTFSDGREEYAEGDDAEFIRQWWKSCETLACLHGAKYKGPYIKVKEPKQNG